MMITLYKRIDGNYLSAKYKVVGTTLVDKRDSDLAMFRWCVVEKVRVDGTCRRYATRSAGGNTIYMHREIAARMGVVGVTGFVDHRDGDSLNNRRANLRAATPSQNMMNMRLRTDASSRYKGVRWDRGKWAAQIGRDGRRVNLGRYASEVAAAKVYDQAAKNLFGEFARLNGV